MNTLIVLLVMMLLGQNAPAKPNSTTTLPNCNALADNMPCMRTGGMGEEPSILNPGILSTQTDSCGNYGGRLVCNPPKTSQGESFRYSNISKICTIAGQKDCIDVVCEGRNIVEGCPNYVSHPTSTATIPPALEGLVLRPYSSQLYFIDLPPKWSCHIDQVDPPKSAEGPAKRVTIVCAEGK